MARHQARAAGASRPRTCPGERSPGRAATPCATPRAPERARSDVRRPGCRRSAPARPSRCCIGGGDLRRRRSSAFDYANLRSMAAIHGRLCRRSPSWRVRWPEPVRAHDGAARSGPRDHSRPREGAVDVRLRGPSGRHPRGTSGRSSSGRSASALPGRSDGVCSQLRRGPPPARAGLPVIDDRRAASPAWSVDQRSTRSTSTPRPVSPRSCRPTSERRVLAGP
jgi:hypothetical protein